MCLLGPLGCALPPALHPGDSIKADRWSRPVQDSEHESPVLPEPLLQIIKTHIVSQNKCRELRRLNGRGSWELAGLTFPTESIPSLAAPLRPGTETWSSANPLHLTFRCDASFLNIMILTLAVTFTLSSLLFLPCMQMFDMTRNKEQTYVLLRKSQNMGLEGIRVQTGEPEKERIL